MNIVFAFTNYNNTSYTIKLIESIHKHSQVPAPIIITDNASTSEHIEKLKHIEKTFPLVKVLFNKKNMGYFGGLNIAIDYVKSSNTKFDVMVIGNNDLIFESNFFSGLSLNSDKFNKYPVISPDIITLDGEHQNPHVINKISKTREIIYDIYYMNYRISTVIEKISRATKKFTGRKDELYHKTGMEIHQGYGACYLLGPIFFHNFKNLLAPTLLMHEEFFISMQLETKGLTTYYEPSIKVLHHCHAATNELPNRNRWELAKNAHRTCKRYRRELKK